MKDISNVSGTIKQIISFEPSTIETIDYSVYDFVDKELNIFCTTSYYRVHNQILLDVYLTSSLPSALCRLMHS